MTIIKNLDEAAPLRMEWLRSFLAVADAGSFTAAARSLRISQPSVSVHVKELESNVHVRLFEHVGGRVRLSGPGEMAAREARRILESVRAFRSALTDSGERVGGKLHIGASTTPGNYLLPRIMSRFEKKYPSVRTSIALDNSARIVERLLANEIDIGVIGFDAFRQEIVSRPWCADELVAFVPKDHRLAPRRALVAGDLNGQRFILREADSATRRATDAWFTRNKIHPVTMELASPETVKRAVAAGLGVGVLSSFAINVEAGESGFSILRAPGMPLRRDLYVARLRRKVMTRTITEFLGMLERFKPNRRRRG